ncbi:MAG: class I SAM-dependent methyltransferase [Gemmataceae bacterium]|nr:class I SAM-dependent methyltransferase [Gemmataceae bacterium]
MLPRVLEPEVMDSAGEARDYDAMDHSQVNRVFVADFLPLWDGGGAVLDVGAGTAQIPIELCRQHPTATVLAVDLARHMLAVAQQNVVDAGLDERIRLQLCDAKRLPYADGSFLAVISNSIVHHAPSPETVIAEMVRVARSAGLIFVRDLLRPADDDAVRRIVETYAGQANEHQRQMFEDSLRAALTLEEVRELVAPFGFAAETVEATSDRHWTWAARPRISVTGSSDTPPPPGARRR